MKTLLLIDNLNSGGAQRQIVNLAIGLKAKGMDVVLVTYAIGDHFNETILKHNISLRSCARRSRAKTIYRVLREIKNQQPDVICAFLFTPSLLALISKLLFGKAKVFVSERFIEHLALDWSKPFARWLYPLAAGIIVNSLSQHSILINKLPRLKPKTFHIPNSVDLNEFRPTVRKKEPTERIRMIGVGRITEYKNIKIVIEALRILVHEKKVKIEMIWVGRQYEAIDVQNKYHLECSNLILKYELAEFWTWAGNRKDVCTLYNESDILIHASYGEGFPNVICEALAVALPVIASRALDHPAIISEGQNGYLFDPQSSQDLAEKVLAYSKLPQDKKDQLKTNCRATAIESFSFERMIDSYSSLFIKATSRA